MNYEILFDISKPLLWFLDKKEPILIKLPEMTCYRTSKGYAFIHHLNKEDDTFISKCAFYLNEQSIGKDLFYDSNYSVYIYSNNSNINNAEIVKLKSIKGGLPSIALLKEVIEKCNLKYEVVRHKLTTHVYVEVIPGIKLLAYTNTQNSKSNDRVLLSYINNSTNNYVIVLKDMIKNFSLPKEEIPLFFSNPLIRDIKIAIKNDDVDYFIKEGIVSSWFGDVQRNLEGYDFKSGMLNYVSRYGKYGNKNDVYFEHERTGNCQLMYFSNSFDVKCILKIDQVSYYDYIKFIKENIPEFQDEDYVAELSSVKGFGGRFYFAKLNNEIIGGFVFERIGTKFIYLSYLALKKEFRNKSLGLELVNSAKYEAKKTHHDILVGVVNDKLISFYENLGFKRKGSWSFY